MLPIHIRRRLLILCKLVKKGDRVLDVGCGVGNYTASILGYLPVRITAIDYDKASIDYAKAHNKHKNVEYIVASGEKFRSDSPYDVIVCSHVLEHTPFMELLLGNMRKLLKNNGRLFLAVPNGYGCFEIENFVPNMIMRTGWGHRMVKWLRGRSVKDSLNYDSPHIHHFTVADIEKLLGKTGWKVVKMYNEQLLGGVITDRTVLRLPMVAKWNMSLGYRLPSWMANGWIFVCEKI